MNPNDAELVRVFTREVGHAIADLTLDAAADFEVVVEGEAGSVLAISGAPYDLFLEVFDLTAGTNPGGNFSQAFAEAFDAATGWPQYTKVVVITPDAGFVQNHIYRYQAALVAPIGIVSFVESPAFILT